MRCVDYSVLESATRFSTLGKFFRKLLHTCSTSFKILRAVVELNVVGSKYADEFMQSKAFKYGPQKRRFSVKKNFLKIISYAQVVVGYLQQMEFFTVVLYHCRHNNQVLLIAMTRYGNNFRPFHLILFNVSAFKVFAS